MSSSYYGSYINCGFTFLSPGTIPDKYSLLMHRIKIKSPPIIFYEMNNTFLCADLSMFNQSYSGGITTTKKPTGYWQYYLYVGCLAAMGLAMEPGVHTMSDELILQILCNIFLAFNTLRPRQNGCLFADDIFKRIFLNENVWISITISLKFVHMVRINNITALVQIMAWRRPGDKPLSELMMVSLLTHICITRPQWVKWILMMRWGQNISHYTIAKPSVHVWNHDLIWWQNKIVTQKTFPQDCHYEL